MYETLHPDVIGYIDINENQHPHYHVKGWCYYHKDGGKNFPIRISNGELILPIISTARPDVALHFKNDTITNCGWEGNITTTAHFEIQMEINEIWVPIFACKAFDTRFRTTSVVPSYLVIDNFYEKSRPGSGIYPTV